jgi:hypothetical protein
MTSTGEEPLAPERQRLRCFVIGPIGNRFAAAGTDEREQYEEAIQVLEEVILPACKQVGLAPIRADGLTRAGEITEQIFRRLRDDDVVIADLTGANANVMYELGLRHTRNALTVQIGEYGRLPFDVTVIRTVQFSRSTHGLITARNELIRLLETGLADEYDLVTATRVWNESEESQSIPPQPPGVNEQSIDVELPEPPGFLDLIAEAEENQQPLADATVAIGERMAELGRGAQAATERFSESDARGAGMRGRLAAATQYAQEIDAVAGQLEGDVSKYETAMASVSAGNLALIERIEEDPTQLSEAIDLGRLLRQLAARAREGLESQQGFVAAMTEAARASRVMRGPVRRVANALDRFSAATQAMDEWDRRLQALGVEVPPDDWEYPDTSANSSA